MLKTYADNYAAVEVTLRQGNEMAENFKKERKKESGDGKMVYDGSNLK